MLWGVGMHIKQLRASVVLASLALAMVLALALGHATDRGQQAELFGLLVFVLVAGVASGFSGERAR